MKKHVLLGLLVGGTLGVAQITGAQPPNIIWSNYFGSYDGAGYAVKQTTDGGYIIAGYIETATLLNTDVYLIKTDSDGNQTWERTYGGSYVDFGYSVQQTTDGGYVVAGSIRPSSLIPAQVYLIKTDANGDTLWTRTFGGNYTDEGRCVQQTADGGYIIAGYAQSSSSINSSDVYLVKTDSAGNQVWQRTFGGTAQDYGYSVQQTADGGYIIAGSTKSFNLVVSNVYLIKTDAEGNLIWQHDFGGISQDEGYSVLQTTDGGYIVAGYTESYGYGGDVYLIKIDAAGNLSWQRTFGGSGVDCAYSVQQTTDGGLIIAGKTRILSTAYNIYLIKTDADGNLIWQTIYANGWGQIGNSVAQIADSGYIIAGENSAHVYLLKTDSGGAPLNLAFNLNPVGLPIVIPANGGSFDFNPTITNNGSAEAPFLIWTRIKFPSAAYTDPLLGPLTLSIPVGMTVRARRTQEIRAAWYAGQYYYLGYIGWVMGYPVVVTDSFPFTKSALCDGNAWETDFACTGEAFSEKSDEAHSYISSSSLTLHAQAPYLSYSIPSGFPVSLTLYDLLGRQIAVLEQGMKLPGTYVTRLPNRLPSGIYLVRLQAGGQMATCKVVMVK